jgi:hypothetical protein
MQQSTRCTVVMEVLFGMEVLPGIEVLFGMEALLGMEVLFGIEAIVLSEYGDNAKKDGRIMDFYIPY